ncbi:hypothetical protein BGAL_0144g00240 [Botrytis galanthina]|uniref:Uncharacterized protein n=1 Tax=Botrytis galanthina TaxID=278940 RepID=A0A4S8QZV7_9HELO|nr:hypothetical protein BGAL_0144g00240 [Botrytis galanthina]
MNMKTLDDPHKSGPLVSSSTIALDECLERTMVNPDRSERFPEPEVGAGTGDLSASLAAAVKRIFKKSWDRIYHDGY